MRRYMTFTYTHPTHHIARNNWWDGYLLKPTSLQFFLEVHRGKRIYRAKGSICWINYDQIKAGLLKKG